MTAPLIAPELARKQLIHFTRMKTRMFSRDRMHETMHQVRQGNITQLFPEELDFSISFNGSPIANFVDVAASDMADGIAPLPSLKCVSGKMQTDADLERAEKKNHIGANYWTQSRLETQMVRGADRYVTYGHGAIIVEPRVDMKLPYLRVVDPRNSYYELDHYGRVRNFARCWRKSIDDLTASFPEHANILNTDPATGKTVENSSLELEVVQWIDGQDVLLMLPERNGLILTQYKHRMPRTPVVIAERPGEGDTPRGQFDDVIWVQVARAIMSTLALEAAHIAVQAPISVPDDMDELPVGPHALMSSGNAKDIHRVDLNLPPAIFAEGQILDQELKTGARYPDVRTGGTQGASVITGKGVQALLGTFDAQIKTAQMIWKQALQDATAMCFQMDEIWWPNESKTVAGTESGTSYEFKYTPAKDINGRYDCTVTYGFAAGLAPAQSFITLLQLDGAGVIAKSTTMENLPFSIDPVQEQRKIDVEGWRGALKEGIFAYIQASGQIASQGGDPSNLFDLAVQVIRGLQDGATIEDALDTAWAQQKAQQQAEQQAAEQQAQAAAAAQGGDAAGGMSINGANGLPPGVAPGQAGMPPGGLPTIESLVSGFRGAGNLPVQQATIQRRIATGTR